MQFEIFGNLLKWPERNRMQITCNTSVKAGRKPEYPEKTHGDELQKMPHTKAQRFKP